MSHFGDRICDVLWCSMSSAVIQLSRIQISRYTAPPTPVIPRIFIKVMYGLVTPCNTTGPCLERLARYRNNAVGMWVIYEPSTLARLDRYKRLQLLKYCSCQRWMSRTCSYNKISHSQNDISLAGGWSNLILIKTVKHHQIVYAKLVFTK